MRMCSPHIKTSRRETEWICGVVETYNKRYLCVKYRNQGVQTSFYESTPSTRFPVGDTVPTGTRREIQGMREQDIPNAPEERDNRGASRFPRILLKRIPGTQSFRRMASSHTLKRNERSQLRTSVSFFLYKLSSEYRLKRWFNIDLQDAYFHEPIHPGSRKYLRFAFEKVYQFWVLPFGLNTAPQLLILAGAYCDRLPPLSGDFGYSIPRRLVSSPSRPSSSTLPSVAATKYAKIGGIYSDRDKVRTGPSTGHPVPRSSVTPGSGESLPPRVQGSLDYNMSVWVMLPINSVISESGSIYGLTQLGLGSYVSVIPESVATTFSLLKTDEPVFSTASVRPAVPCQPTSAVAGPIFSNVRYRHPTFPGGIHHFHGRFYPGVGCPHGGFSNFGYLDPSGSPA